MCAFLRMCVQNKTFKKAKVKKLGIKSRDKYASFGSDQTVILDFPSKGTHSRFHILGRAAQLQAASAYPYSQT